MCGDLGNNDLPTSLFPYLATSYHSKFRSPITNAILLTENNKVMIL